MAAIEARQWWKNQRKKYNLALCVSSIAAFFSYSAVVISMHDRLPCVEITGFTILFQAAGFLISLAIANVAYFLGVGMEIIVRPKNPDSYRKFTYGMGFWFSVALPLLVPVYALISAIFGQNNGECL